MKITKLYIQNFLSVGKIECALDDKGLVLIQGENQDDTSQDSNGSGKSSFADAISWCLYGVTARGESTDAVVNRTAKKDCQVFLHIEDDKERYFIERNRKHKTRKNSLRVGLFTDEHTYTDLTKGTDKETQKVVDSIIGCSQEVFNAAIYAGQEQMVDLPGMTDKQLKTLVEEAAGIDRLQSAYTRALAKHQISKSNFERVSRTIESLKENSKMLSEEVDSAKLHEDGWVTTHQSELRDAVEKAKLEKKAHLDAESKRPTLMSKIEALDEKSAEFKEKSENLAAEKADRDRLYKDTLDKNSVRYSWDSKLNDAISKKKKLVEEIKDIKSQVGKPCGECGKPYAEEDLDAVIALKKEKAREIRDEGLKFADEVEKAEKATQDAQAALSDFEASMTDMSAEIAAERTRQSEKRVLEHEIQLIETKRLSAERTLKEAKAISVRVNPHTATRERLEKRLQEANDLLAETVSDKAKAEDDLKVAKEVMRVFSPAGVRAYILDTVTPYLNARTSHYLNTLTDGNITAIWNTLSTTAKGELREKFSIQVESACGAASFKGLSGGEKRKVRLACSMALQDLVGNRATKPIDLYIADEIDHALDESGLERLTMILDEKAKMKGTALVISHNSLNSYIRQHVTVVKKSGMSELEGVALNGD